MSDEPRRPGVNWKQAAGEALLIFVGVGVHICYSISALQHNQTVDSDIEQYLHQLTSSGSAGATFSLLKSCTQVG